MHASSLFFAPKAKKIALKLDKIKSKNWRRHRKKNTCCSAAWVDLKHILNNNPTSMKDQNCHLFNVNLSQPKLNSISTKLRLHVISTSFQPQPLINLNININLNSTSTLTSTQYGCDIKATQSCSRLCYSTLPQCA